MFDIFVRQVYTGLMKTTNRELLRNYREIKEKLLRGEIKEINIAQREGVWLTMLVKRPQTSFEELLEMIEEEPIYAQRPKEDII